LEDSFPKSLGPYRALDLTEGGFNWCGKALGDLGADVIKIEPPGGSPTRDRGPFFQDRESRDTSLFWNAYCVNKRSVTLDIETTEGQETFRRLARGADIVIESFAPGYMDSLGLGYDALSRENPGLIVTSITPFGQTGPYADYKASDIVAWSMGGMQYICGDADRPPARITFPQAELNAGGQALAGTMAAFWHRQRTGQGQHVDVSMQVAVVWTLMNATPFPPLHGVNLERNGAFHSRGALNVRQVFPCKDGYVTLLSANPTVQKMLDWMIEEGAAPDWLLDFDAMSLDRVAMASGGDQEGADKFHEIQRLEERFVQRKSKQELYERALSHGILLAPCNTVDDIAASPQLAARDFWIDLDVPAIGDNLRHLGPYIKMNESPLMIRRPAPRIGEHNDEILGELDSQTETPPSAAISTSDDTASKMPFEGLKVLDFTWVGVGPITIKYLADHGADVIRIESVSRPDVLRMGAPFKDATPGINRSQFPASYNTSKLGLGLNMAHPEARKIVRDLIETWQPDIISESFTPRVMASWGLGYEDVKAMKSDIIYFSTCQQGQTGPHAHYAGFGQLAASMAGYYHVTGWPDREPAAPYGAYSDFVNPPNAFSAIVAALEYRRRTGKGQRLDLAQFECAAQYLAPAVMDYTANGRVLGRQGNTDARFAPHGVYPCANAERKYTGDGASWLSVAVENEEQWAQLCGIIGDESLSKDNQFSSMELRRENSAALDARISDWTRTRNAHETMALLQSAGVPAGAVQSQADLWEDPQLGHREFFTWLDHAECGPMPYDGLQFLLSRSPGKLRMPQALIGQHNEVILKEKLGMSEGQIGKLVAEGVLEAS
ncbi:MAG: CoA transferase, partial [SAR202 cluster bacterium]|nr:CoA transferase [SAR202 cluster bacterium]